MHLLSLKGSKKANKFLFINLLLQVLKENNVKKEELRLRATALKILGKIFQVQIFRYFGINYFSFQLSRNIAHYNNFCV